MPLLVKDSENRFMQICSLAHLVPLKELWKSITSSFFLIVTEGFLPSVDFLGGPPFSPPGGLPPSPQMLSSSCLGEEGWGFPGVSGSSGLGVEGGLGSCAFGVGGNRVAGVTGAIPGGVIA